MAERKQLPDGSWVAISNRGIEYPVGPDGRTIHHWGEKDPSNMIQIKHGANSEKVLSVVAQDVCEALIGVYPWVLDCDVVAIEQYCRAEARARLLHNWAMAVVEGGIENKDRKRGSRTGVLAVPAYIWREIATAESNAGRFAESLGLTPMGRVKIAKDAGFARHFERERVQDLISQGRKLRQGA